jgi:hypothetical protein
MVRLTASTIRRMRAAGQLPPPVPPVNSNSNSNNNNNKAQIARVKQLMTDHIGLRRASPNVLPNNVNKNNVSTYYNSNFSNSESKNIPKNKRVYISKDVVKGKVKQVYNQDGIIEILLRSKNFNGVSPISRKRFSIKNVIPFT